MTSPLKNKSKNWTQNPEAVQRDILDAATKIFAEQGLSGARMDDIASATKTSKRMIYYYFGGKDELYTRVLEAAYSKVRIGEEKLDLAGLPASKALEKLVGFTFDHHRKHPDFIRIVMIENIHHAAFLGQSEVVRDLNLGAIKVLAELLRRGEASGEFRTGLNPTVLHWQISAMSSFNVSNMPTFSALFGADLFTESGQLELRDHVVQMILSHALKT